MENNVLTATGNTPVTFQVRNGADLSIEVTTDEEPRWEAPFDTSARTPDGATGILAVSGQMNILGNVSNTGPLPTITVTTAGSTYWMNGQKASTAANNYAVVSCKGRWSSSQNKGNLIFEKVNLKVENVSEGLYAGQASSLSIKDSDFFVVTANDGGLQHHGITVVDAGNIDITSREVKLFVAGIATEADDPLTVFSSGLRQVYGGKISIEAFEKLEIQVNTENKYKATVNGEEVQGQNYGVYALGQGGNKGEIYLKGKGFSLEVSGSKNDDGDYGLVSAVYNADSFLQTEFATIGIVASGAGIVAQTLNKNAQNHSSTTEVKASESLAITARTGIKSEAENGNATIEIHSPKVNVDSEFIGISNYSDFSSQTGEGGPISTISVSGNQISIVSGVYGIYTDDRNPNKLKSEVNVQAGELLSLSAPVAVYSLSEIGQSASVVRLNAEGKGTTQIDGGVVSYHSSEVKIGLNSRESLWQGFSQDARLSTDLTGSINVVAKNGATWKVKPVDEGRRINDDTKSYLTSWSSLDSSNIDLRLENKTYQAVDIGSFSGTGTTFLLATDVNGERGEGRSTDQAIIHEGHGAHRIFVESTGSQPWTEAQVDYLIWHKEENGAQSIPVSETGSDEALSFSLANPNGVVDVGLYYYKLASRDSVEQGTEWYLERTNPEESDPETPSGELVTDFGGVGASRAFWFAQLEDLRKRLGEVRYGAQDGLWARLITRKDSVDGTADGSFESKWYGINFGIDHLVVRQEDHQWLIGTNLIYGEADQKIHASSKGTGDLDALGLNLYATYANHHGCYADFVLTADRYDQKLSTVMTDGKPTKGSFDTWGWGASVEIGKMFSSTQNDEDWGPWYNHWWIEPQAQLAYGWFKGKNWSLDNGMQVSQGNGQSLIGRLGIVLGKQFKYGKEYEEVDKRYSQFYVKAGIKHEFLGKQTIYANDVKFDNRLDGTTFYYGAGLDWNFTDQARAYFQVEKETGDHYDKDYEVSVGLKWQF